MRQYYRDMPVKFKLVAIFLAVILANLLASLFYQREVRRLVAFYNETQEDHYRVNKISLSLKEAKNSLDEYYTNGTETAVPEYERKKQEVQTLVGQLTNRRDNPAEWYMIHAITNSSQVFFEKCDSTVDRIRQREDRIYIEYYKAENILGYLGGYINQYLNVILEEDSKEYTVLENHAASMETMTRVFLMCSVAVSLLAALNLSESVAGPLRELAKYSREISGGNFDIQDVAVRSRDEVGELAAAFNGMKENIRHLIQDLNQKSQVEARLHQQELKNIRMDELLRESQLLALQSQISPHFLFNTLNSISRSAQYGTPQVTTALIRNLADLFRYNLDHFNRLSTVGDEVDIVEKYIYIQTHRFGDRICYRARVQETCREVLIPSMTLQPLVENAIIHGIENLESGGEILTDIRIRKTHVRIRICDNGAGITREQLQKIREGKSGKRTGHTTGIGVSNITTRISLYPGGSLGLYSSPRYGTIVQILFPLKPGGLAAPEPLAGGPGPAPLAAGAGPELPAAAAGPAPVSPPCPDWRIR